MDGAHLPSHPIQPFHRRADGALEPPGEYPIGGAGLGAMHLASQGSVILTSDDRSCW